MLAALLKKFANSTTISCIDERGILTYAELFYYVEKLVNITNKIPDAATVGFYANNGRDFLAALVTSIEQGFCCIPLNPNQTKSEETQIVVELGINYILDLRSDIKIETFSDSVQLKNLTFVRPTSGTTGKQKGVVVSYQAALQRALNTAEGLEIKEGTRIIWVMPMCFHFLASILGFLLRGATIICTNSPLAEVIFNACEKYSGEQIFLAPQTALLLANLNGEKKFSTVRRVISTAGFLNRSVADLFLKRFGLTVTQAYGAIEVGIPLIDLKAIDSRSVGAPIKGYQAKLSEDGELMLKGGGFFSGYLNPLLDADQILIEGWFPTGDIADLTPLGNYRIIGRKKTVIITAGNKVFPEEIEEIITELCAIHNVRVFGEEHPLLGERLVAEIVGSYDEKRLKAGLRERLVSYKIPLEFRNVAEIKKTATGKIRRY